MQFQRWKETLLHTKNLPSQDKFSWVFLGSLFSPLAVDSRYGHYQWPCRNIHSRPMHSTVAEEILKWKLKISQEIHQTSSFVQRYLLSTWHLLYFAQLNRKWETYSVMFWDLSLADLVAYSARKFHCVLLLNLFHPWEIEEKEDVKGWIY